MDICFGYIWISFGYGLDMFRIYSQAAWPGASPRRPASAAGGPGLGRPGRCQWVSQSASHGSSSPGHQCQADSSMMPVPGGQALGI